MADQHSLLQSSIDLWKTITPEVSYIAQCNLPMAELPPLIGHRCLEYCYTKLGRSTNTSIPSIEHRCLEDHYTKLGISTGRPSPSQLSIDPLNTITPNLADLLADLPPGQSSSDALHTATPNLTDLLADIPPSQSSIVALNTPHQTWQIYWQIYPPVNQA